MATIAVQLIPVEKQFSTFGPEIFVAPPGQIKYDLEIEVKCETTDSPE